jgi:hypothetical protein
MDLRADGEARDIERLSKEQSIDREREELSELGGVDVGRGQDGLIHVLPGALVVVVISQYRDGSHCLCHGKRSGLR